MIAGILRPTSGTVHIGDIDIAAEPMGGSFPLELESLEIRRGKSRSIGFA